MRYLKRPQSERDIEECFVYIATENLDSGIEFLVEVEDTLLQLTRFPFLGKIVEFNNKPFQNMRRCPVRNFKNYIIFYIPREEAVEVIRVLHGARDLEDIFVGHD